MFFYIGVGFLLWVITIPGLFVSSKTGISFFLALIVFWFICSFRFETGFDWVVYEQYFNAIESSDFLEFPQDVVSMEPLFYLANYLVSRVAGFQLFLFLVGTFNTYCACRFFRRFDSRVSLGFAFVFCWVYFPLEMGTIRQSIAVSIMLLSMESFVFGKTKKALVGFLIAMGFQYSVLMYSPIFFIRGIRFLIKYVWVYIFVCLLFYGIGIGFGQIAVALGSVANVPFVSEKLAIYADLGFSARTIAGGGYLVLNCMLLGLAKLTIKNMGRRELLLLGSLVCLIGAQSFLFDFALIWNRIQYLACFAQAVIIYDVLKLLRAPARALVVSSVAIFSLSSLLFFVSAGSATPFIPYNSFVEYALTQERGDGRERAQQYYEDFNAANKAQ
ncbi:EpsG family protein [Pseudomonas sp. S3_E11]